MALEEIDSMLRVEFDDRLFPDSRGAGTRSAADSSKGRQDSGLVAGGRADLFAGISGRFGIDGGGSACFVNAAHAQVDGGVIRTLIIIRLTTPFLMLYRYKCDTATAVYIRATY